MKQKIVFCTSMIVVMIMCIPQPANADKVLWDVITSGGVVASSSGANMISSSIGQVAVDVLDNTTNRIYSGFWNPWLSGAVGTGYEIPFGVPTSFQLHRNYPNPFHSQTKIHYDIVLTSQVTPVSYTHLTLPTN